MNPYGIALGIFLLFNFLLGFLKGGKAQTFKEFATGNKIFSLPKLTASILATAWGGGCFFGSLEKMFEQGIYSIIPFFIMTTIGFLLVANILALGLGPFLSHFSIAETMGAVYGNKIRYITAIAGILRCISSLAVQIFVTSQIFHHFFVINSNAALIASCLIAILYSTFCGIRAVVITDLFQLILFIIVLPLLCFVVIHQLGIFKNIDSAIVVLKEHPKFDLDKLCVWSTSTKYMLITCISVRAPDVVPHLVQRMYLTKDLGKVKAAFNYAALGMFLLSMCLIVIGILLFVANPNLDTKTIIPFICDKLVRTDYKILLMLGILAMSMSTADSAINTAAVLFVNDLLHPFKLTDAKKLALARWSSFLMGGVTLLLTLFIKNLFLLFLLGHGAYFPLVTIPFVVALLRFRPGKMPATIGMLASIVYLTVGVYLQQDTVTIIVSAMFVNLLVMVIIYFLFPQQRGAGRIAPDKHYDQLKQEEQFQRAAFWANMRKHLTVAYYHHFLPKKLKEYVLLSFYLMLTTLLSMVFISPYTLWEQSVLQTIYLPTLGVSLLLLLYPAQQEHTLLQRISGVLWYVICLCFLVIMPTLTLCIAASNHSLALLTVLFGIYILLLYFPRRDVVLMVWVGGSIALYTCMQGSTGISCYTFLMKFALTDIYIVIMTTFVACYSFYKTSQREKGLLALGNNYQLLEQEEAIQLKKKQHDGLWDQFTKTPSGREKALVNLQHDLDTLLTMRFDNNGLDAQQAIQDIKDKLTGYTEHLFESQLMNRNFTTLDLGVVHIERLLYGIRATMKKMGLSIRLLVKNYSNQKEIIGDYSQLKSAFIKGLCVVAAYDKEEEDTPLVHLYVNDTTIDYALSLGEGSQSHQLKAVSFIITTQGGMEDFPTKYGSVKDHILLGKFPDKTIDLYQMQIDTIICGHYGHFESDITKDGSQFFITNVLPINLPAIRDANSIGRLPKGVAPPATPELATLEKTTIAAIVAKTGLSSDYTQSVIELVKQGHAEQKRESGDPFYTHPLEVAQIVLEISSDPILVQAALLHDIVEDSAISMNLLKSLFGTQITYLVGAVTHLSEDIRKKKLAPEEKINLLIARGNQDGRVIILKLADRLHNLRTLHYRPLSKQLKVAQETMAIYIPLGIHFQVLFVKEMQQICEKIVSNQDK